MNQKRIEEMVRRGYRIWRNPTPNRAKLWRWVVYCSDDPIGQFKKEEHAKLFLDLCVQRDVEELVGKAAETGVRDGTKTTVVPK